MKTLLKNAYLDICDAKSKLIKLNDELGEYWPRPKYTAPEYTRALVSACKTVREKVAMRTVCGLATWNVQEDGTVESIGLPKTGNCMNEYKWFRKRMRRKNQLYLFTRDERWGDKPLEKFVGVW